MISADHLDWHGSLDAYVDAKTNLLRFQRPDDFAVLNEQDLMTAGMSARITRAGDLLRHAKPQALRSSPARRAQSAQRPGRFRRRRNLRHRLVKAQKALSDFTGLPHRLQMVLELAGVRYVDDSIATIPDAAVAALHAFAAKEGDPDRRRLR